MTARPPRSGRAAGRGGAAKRGRRADDDGPVEHGLALPPIRSRRLIVARASLSSSMD
jgi:hypothetical protein